MPVVFLSFSSHHFILREVVSLTWNSLLRQGWLASEPDNLPISASPVSFIVVLTQILWIKPHPHPHHFFLILVTVSSNYFFLLSNG